MGHYPPGSNQFIPFETADSGLQMGCWSPTAPLHGTSPGPALGSLTRQRPHSAQLLIPGHTPSSTLSRSQAFRDVDNGSNGITMPFMSQHPNQVSSA